MDGANDLHMLLRDPSLQSNLPSAIYRHNAVRHALPEELFYRSTNQLHKASYSDRIPVTSLVTHGYLTLPASIAWPADPNVSIAPASEWRKSRRVMELAVTASKYVPQVEANATIAVDEKNG